MPTTWAFRGVYVGMVLNSRDYLTCTETRRNPETICRQNMRSTDGLGVIQAHKTTPSARPWLTILMNIIICSQVNTY